MATDSLVPIAAEDHDDLESSARSPGPLSVSVIIPHYNDLDRLGACLSLLAAQSMQRQEFEIIVADNNSQCGIAMVGKACAGFARVVLAPNQGAAEARNAGVRASKGRFLAFIDSDCRPCTQWLEHGIKALNDADMAGGSVEVYAIESGNPTAVEAFEIVFAFNFKRYIEKEGFSGAGNMFVSRAIFDSVGGFRTGVSEDRDWGRRAVAMGYRWRYEPQARVSHPARRDWADLKRKWSRMVEEAYGSTKEQPFGRLYWILRSWLVLVSPFFHTVVVIQSAKLSRSDLRLKAIAVLFRLRIWRFKQYYRVLLTDLWV